MEYKVSILVPIFGVEKYIEYCARSLFEQTYHNIEYIFVNDCTRDNSIDILLNVLEQYPNRKEQVKIVHHEQNRGLSAARNTALLNSTSDYIVNVDSDDYIDKDFIEQCVNKIIETDADIIFTGRRFIYSNFTKDIHIPTHNNVIEWRNALLSGIFPHTVWGCLIRKSIYIDNNIRAIEGLHQGEDFAVMCRLVHYVKKIDIIKEPLYNYLIRTNIYKYNRKTANDTFLSWEIVEKFYRKTRIYHEVENILWNRMLYFYIWQIRSWVKSTNIDKEEAIFLKNLFPTIQNYSKITILKRIVLLLFKNNCYHSLKFYTVILDFFQKLTLRRGREV